MSFSFRPAKRENVPLLIGVAGGTGSGKTYSALTLAKGLANGQRFAIIDTEAGRAKHYADLFEFDHGDLEPPFTPQSYATAIAAADAAKYPVIVVDSASHEHAGDGGLLDMHDAELDRMAGTDWAKRERVKMAAWIEPKTQHKRFVSKLLQVRAHVILCFRAQEAIEIVKVNGKTEIRPKQTLTGLDGWVPISEKNLPYELTLSFLLTADKPGVPKPIKLQEQHRPMVPLDQPISEETGKRLGAWAQGSGAEPVPQSGADVDGEGSRIPESAPDITTLHDELVALVTELGATDSLPLLEEKTAAGDVEWLQRQIATAKQAIADRWQPEQESFFEQRAREAQAGRS